MARAYASSDIFIFLSTTETLGLVILEAVASGLPVVAAESGPTYEQIDDGGSGMLFDPRSSQGFVEAVLKMGNPYLRASISAKARKVSRRMGWSQPSRQLLGFYEQVLQDYFKSDLVL